MAKRRKQVLPKAERPDQRLLLLDAAVSVIAKSGIEGASVRAIAAEASPTITDAVIYRHFSGKDELLLQAFLRVDAMLYEQIEKMCDVLWEKELPTENRLRFLWHSVWTWVTEHRTEVCFAVRYYYSASYDAHAEEENRKIWRTLAEKLKELFPCVDADCLVGTAIEQTLTALYPICSGRTPDSASFSEFAFRKVYGALKELFPSAEGKGSGLR